MRVPKKFRHLAPAGPGTAVNEPVPAYGPLRNHPALGRPPPIPDHVQSRNLCGPQRGDERAFVCSARDRLDNNPEMIRTIRTKKYRYIRNFLPHQPYASFYPDGGFFAPVPQESSPERAFWETSCLPSKEKVHDPDGVFLMLGPPTIVRENGLSEAYRNYLIWQDHKPLEELYDVENDPEQIHNLADDPTFGEVKDELREKLYSWMIETDDLGLLDETEIVARGEPWRSQSDRGRSLRYV